MATGERLTLTYAHPPCGPLKVDLYCYVPPVNPVDPTPALDRLPFILFLHGGHFFTGSRRDVPIWVVSLARSLGTPLLSADYRLAPHAGPSHAFEDLKSLWKFIQSDLQWIIASSGQGAEVESGVDPLEDDFTDLQRRGGIDPNKCVIIGVGSGGYLAAMGGGILSPAPTALVLGYPTLDFSKSTSTDTFPSAKTPAIFSELLASTNIGRVDEAMSIIPDMPLLLERAPYAASIRESSGMDIHETWHGKEESMRRKGLVEYLLRTNQWSQLLYKASSNFQTPKEMLNSRINRPYPPTIIYHGLKDERTSASTSEKFIADVRDAEPVAAAVDALSSVQQSTSSQERNIGTLSFKSANRINETSRFVYLGIQGASHGFDTLLPRLLSSEPYTRESPKVMGDRYKAGMIQVEYFIRHWLEEGSADIAAKSANQSRLTTPIDTNKGIDESKGARVKIPRAPRL